MLFARSSRANAPHDVSGGKSSLRCCFRGSGKVSANKHWRTRPRLRPTRGEVPPPLEEAFRYLETQQDWMGNYQQWQADGYPVGSGLVERAVAVVINMRMKKRGMRWTRKATTAVALARFKRINAEWEDAAA
jgi:hypothetical protein